MQYVIAGFLSVILDQDSLFYIGQVLGITLLLIPTFSLLVAIISKIAFKLIRWAKN